MALPASFKAADRFRTTKLASASVLTACLLIVLASFLVTDGGSLDLHLAGAGRGEAGVNRP